MAVVAPVSSTKIRCCGSTPAMAWSKAARRACTRGAPSLQQPHEEGQANGEELGDLTQRIRAAIDDAHNAFTQVVGVRTHEDTSSGDLPPDVILSRMPTMCEPL